MSNVLVGIVGIILFIGLVLASATFFGPVVGESIDDAEAGGVVRVLTATSNAVVIRNREMETITQGSADSSVLVPNYLDEAPINPVSKEAVMIADGSFRPSSDARFVVSRMGASDQAECAYLNFAAGEARSVPTVNSAPNTRMGCVRLASGNGVFSAGDMIAFMAVE